MSAPQANDAEKNIEIWKVKKLIKRLEAARGNGTSMISLIIPPKDQVSRAAKMLAEEFVRVTPLSSTKICVLQPGSNSSNRVLPRTLSHESTASLYSVRSLRHSNVSSFTTKFRRMASWSIAVM